MSTGKVPLRVHDVIIKGNSKTKDYLIEAEVENIKNAATMQELLEAAGIANAKLQALEIFDSVRVTLDSDRLELPGTANVVVEVVETKNPLYGECGAYTKPAGFDLRYALPFRFYNFALNLRISGGVIFPQGSGFLDKLSSLPLRFFLGGDFSPVCTVAGPTTVWGFKTSGIGPTEPRRQNGDKLDGESSDSFQRDVGGDLAVTAFADLSFDLPRRWLREHGMHGHIFAVLGTWRN
ncbi:uncharacterized protein LOC133795826 [Humulus lupulus]|uniref:uncharacterized protein LOC133795826 n=1 Tax=Humulus lupulus TaxID=3486 RepID=UPI002B40EE85|nr:uncharacterized protein LOC133795826 [Humulus lupulus]